MVLYSPTQQNYTFSGVLELIRTRNIKIKNTGKKSERVLVVVHKTSTNHFAVIYPIWGLDSSRKPICTINLLSTKVEKCSHSADREFSVVSTQEGVSFSFRTPDKTSKDVYSSDDWIEALSNSNTNQSLFLKSSTTVPKRRQMPLNLSVLDEEVNEEND